jgi:hypothetical protein
MRVAFDMRDSVRFEGSRIHHARGRGTVLCTSTEGAWPRSLAYRLANQQTALWPPAHSVSIAL